MTNGQRPTLEVVAARAGVSRATASRVLRGAQNVSEEARAAVLSAAEEIAYTPNLAARALVTRRSDSIAFLVAESEDRLFGDPYFLTMLRGAQAETAEAGLQLVFVVASTDAEALAFERYASGGHVDGVLVLSLHGDDRLPQRLESIGVATVLNGRPYAGDRSLYYVDSDNLGGGRAATELLLERGSRCIATITGPLDMVAGLDRLAGFEQAMQAARRKPLKRHVVNGDFTVEGGAAAMNQLLDTEPNLDAVFAASDLTAIGAIQAITARGLRVPDDIAVVGFDDVPQAAVTTPALTTVRQPIDELGRTSARILLRRISGEKSRRANVLPVEIVRRASA
ncbi:MAG TPA: LacI family DNA-binding transcriptional regulator [Jatrophihabitantaceae bacterium]|nr:LacI family DNA-binding transcriptional regulator [Jatrophihabitantaceae bacterium]